MTKLTLCLTAALLTSTSARAAAQDLVITAGSTVVYNTDVSGRLDLDRFIIERSASFVVIGSRPFRLTASVVDIDGLFMASGQNSAGVLAPNTSLPELGARGRAGGGDGGASSQQTTSSTALGGDGQESYGISFPGVALGGGQGGEGAYSPSLGPLGADQRRGAGGGGGALAANQPRSADPFAAANTGLIGQPGMDGNVYGSGAVFGSGRARGGLPGLPVFQDGDSSNDFWGIKVSGQGALVGEARRPLPGRGGGAGGDAVRTSVFPLNPFNPGAEEKGASGGGGGGLVLILARSLRIGPEGQVKADGGRGGGGENVIFFDRVGGGSGAGSGGWIVIEAWRWDLSEAPDGAITALGGRGGPGEDNRFPDGPFGPMIDGAGGSGGPGVIQLHAARGSALNIALPPGKSIADVTAPEAHVLLPILSR